MAEPNGFGYVVRKGGEIVVTHHGTAAAVLRGRAAERFLAEIDRSDDPQLVMARVTGNYRRGNERTAAEHRRNRGR
jgi:antitoxin (DNA-binding transcriptional repressor) of toxin-antitoxin stability system